MRPLSDYAPPDAPIDLPGPFFDDDDRASPVIILLVGAISGMAAGILLTMAGFLARGWLA